jgi:hypothetical protein
MTNSEHATPLRVLNPDYCTGLIPRDCWQQFLADFTRLRGETTCRLELVEADGRTVDLLVEDRPFLAASIDEGRRATDVVLEFGDTAGATPRTFAHRAKTPVAIWAHESCPGCIEAIEIETRDEGTLILTINPHPERDTISFKEAGRSELRPF